MTGELWSEISLRSDGSVCIFFFLFLFFLLPLKRRGKLARKKKNVHFRPTFFSFFLLLLLLLLLLNLSSVLFAHCIQLTSPNLQMHPSSRFFCSSALTARTSSWCSSSLESAIQRSLYFLAAFVPASCYRGNAGDSFFFKVVDAWLELAKATRVTVRECLSRSVDIYYHSFENFP